MQDKLLSQGPPPLYQSAADASIDLIDFIAAAVRGVDLIDVTEAVRARWRSYLAAYFTTIPMQERQWFANAPAALAEINNLWGRVSDMQRQTTIQMWASYLPGLLQFALPVLSGGHSQQAAPQPHAAQQQSGAGDPVLSELVNRALGGGGQAGDPVLSQLVNQALGGGQAGDPVPSQLVNQALGGGQAGDPVPSQLVNQALGGGQAGDPVLSQLVNQVISEGQRRVAEAPNAAARARQENYNSHVASTMLSNMAAFQRQSRMAVANNLRA